MEMVRSGRILDLILKFGNRIYKWIELGYKRNWIVLGNIIGFFGYKVKLVNKVMCIF